jgi:predicted nucleotide-binding protein
MYNVMYTLGDTMARMVRKQIYIYKRQQAQLKRISEARGISEAEIIRNALDREVNSQIAPYHYDEEAWKKILEAIDKQAAEGVSGEPYKFRREDAYEERENRWLKNRD